MTTKPSPERVAEPQRTIHLKRGFADLMICSRMSACACFLAALWILSIAGCGDAAKPARTGVVVGLGNSYNYSPSVIQTGDQQQFWWCAQAVNPTNSSQNTDTIQYQSINTTTQESPAPVTVLAETANAWDSVFTCNPKVIRGVFSNPLGNGQNYTYEMFYVATAVPSGVDNSIGAAFSNDGITWNKYPHPVILSTSRSGYGVGQPAVYNQDGKSAIVVIYEDNTPTIHHVKTVSTDGIHFTVQGTLTMNGLDPTNPNPSWGDMAFDPVTGDWYAAFDTLTRYPTTTGGVIEHGQYGIELYRIPDASLLSGATPWQRLKSFDTNLTGYEANFIPSFLRDGYGNLNVGSYPQIKLFTSISDPPAAWDATPQESGYAGDLYTWVIGSVTYTPNQPLVTLNRYSNLLTYDVTTGWVDPGGGFLLDISLGHLYEAPQQGATVAFYGCKNGATDYFVSTDSACNGLLILGLEGYGYAHPVANTATLPLYRCDSEGKSHFVSHDAKCEGRGPGMLLGYAMP